MKKNIIIFDFDGVIADSQEVIFDIYQELCKKHPLKEVRTKKEFAELFNVNFFESLKKMGLSEEEFTGVTYELHIRLREDIQDIVLFAGVKDMISILSGSHRLMIVTSNFSDVVQNILKTYHIDGVENVIGAEHETNKIHKLLDIASKNPEHQIYYICDTVGDIAEGKKAATKTVAVTWGYHKNDALKKAEPDYLVNSPQEIVNLFEN